MLLGTCWFLVAASNQVLDYHAKGWKGVLPGVLGWPYGPEATVHEYMASAPKIMG